MVIDQRWLSTPETAAGRRPYRPVVTFFTWLSLFVHTVATGQGYDDQDSLGSYAVANGKVTSISRHPSAVFVHISVGTCSGTLISKHFILTASHCTFKPPPIEVYVGDKKKYSGMKYTIKAVIRHPDYGGNVTGRRNDIAMLYTKVPVQLSKSVQIADMIKPVDVNNLKNTCYVAGWGRLSRKKKILTNTLHEGVMVTAEAGDCRSENSSFSDDSDICMKWFKPKLQTTANGDSGAGLFCYSNARNKYVLTGTNSGGIGYNMTVFSKISFYSEWIRSVFRMQKNGDFDSGDPNKMIIKSI
ncbi:chymotrypsin-like elastase family member 2B [Octopus bimaculoides]|uniref:Peptidase S1 domain-containing protein n=1 Tax=Octopus bimaculoides TaxID=37653 RepID=A0A0L8HKP4_OCTBM|nr:chymotrypsin-like elastase family member 2B [Octopus bimaculoides]|eukprot:XP_014771580.1 PREDICTED: chymotrypsin-like elastase family member 2B [Octopus bimaculoides]